MKTSLSILLAVAVFFSACKKDHNGPQFPAQTNFVSATPITSLTKADLQALAAKGGYGAFAALVKYDVDYYKMIYKTTFKGKEIQVSGLLGIPKNTPAPPSIMSAQHGTMYRFADAPTNFPSTFTGFELFAGAGFVDLVPDYIGYGVSTSIVHPYYDQPSSALTVIDMIKAARYFLQKQNIAYSPRLFLLGYSEGGYVTMAAQKEIETNTTHNIILTAAAEGAGGYDLITFLSVIASTPVYAVPSQLAFLVRAYNTTYDWNRPYTDFFQSVYASKIPTLFDGTKGREEIDPQLTTSTAGLFNPVFYSALSDPTRETVLKQQLAANSFLTWVPRSPTRLYHGTADESVPFATSVATYNRFQAAGATNVQFFPIPGGTHGSSIQPMLADAVPWILSQDR